MSSPSTTPSTRARSRGSRPGRRSTPWPRSSRSRGAAVKSTVPAAAAAAAAARRRRRGCIGGVRRRARNAATCSTSQTFAFSRSAVDRQLSVGCWSVRGSVQRKRAFGVGFDDCLKSLYGIPFVSPHMQYGCKCTVYHSIRTIGGRRAGREAAVGCCCSGGDRRCIGGLIGQLDLSSVQGGVTTHQLADKALDLRSLST